MSQSGDQLDCAGSGGAGITDLVFDDQNQERRSWRFCNSRLPRSEVVHFTQVSIIVFLIVVSLTKSVFFQLDCEESTFWFSLLSCTVGYALPNLCTVGYALPNLHGSLWSFRLWKDRNYFSNAS